MTLNPFTVAFIGMTLILEIVGGIILYLTRKFVPNPAQWKTIKLVSEWVDIDPITGNKIKRTQTEFWRVRV